MGALTITNIVKAPTVTTGEHSCRRVQMEYDVLVRGGTQDIHRHMYIKI